jgi:hypothetical protein
MRVREQEEGYLLGVELEILVIAPCDVFRALEHAAIDEDPFARCLKQIARACDYAGRSVECQLHDGYTNRLLKMNIAAHAIEKQEKI